MHYLYRYVCILNVFFYMCIWTIVCNKEFIYYLYYQRENASCPIYQTLLKFTMESGFKKC